MLKTFIILTILLVFYFLLSTSINLFHLIVGTITFISIIYFCNYIMENFFRDIFFSKFELKKFIFWLKFAFLSLEKIIKANVDVAERVLDPKLPIEPSIVKIKVPFRDNNLVFTILTNTITLTPGTLAVDYENEYVYVHFLAEEYIEALSFRNLEKKVKEELSKI